jgi:hypothetical protein
LERKGVAEIFQEFRGNIWEVARQNWRDFVGTEVRPALPKFSCLILATFVCEITFEECQRLVTLSSVAKEFSKEINCVSFDRFQMREIELKRGERGRGTGRK